MEKNKIPTIRRLYPKKTINELFEEQVFEKPDDIALIFHDEKITYKELNEKTNQLSNYLIDKYEISNKLIPIILNPSTLTIITILAIIKSGAAYVPIDPDLPNERMKYIIKDTKTRLVLTTRDHVELIKSQLKDDIIVDLVDNDYSNHNADNPHVDIDLNDLAYVIYTSGTTGLPKGVMIKHESVSNLITQLKHVYDMYEGEVFILLANYMFDTSVEEIFTSLLNGYSLLITEKNSWMNKNKFINEMEKNKLTTLTGTPSLLEQIDVKKIKSLRRIISGGEVLSKETIKQINSDKYDLINSYGPTETTVYVSYNIISDNNFIGNPLPNYSTYVLDNFLNPAVKGTIGELYIGGVGLSKGYLNQKELTKEKFINNPYQTPEERKEGFNDKIYKTGDLVIYHGKKGLEFIGRIDDQVKIRGQRVELMEIETYIQKQRLINSARVLYMSFNNTHLLCAYFTLIKKLSDSEIEDFKNELKNCLKNILPSYMIPQFFIPLDEFPLTVNGKLDIKKLPKPTQLDNICHSSNELEKELLKIAIDIVGYDFGVNNSLLSVGFNSLLFFKLINQIHEKYSIELDYLMLLSEDLNIRKLAKKIESSEAQKELKHEEHTFYPLSTNQLSELLSLNMDTAYSDDVDRNDFHFCVNFDDSFDVYKLRDSLLEVIEMNSYMKAHATIRPNLMINQKRNDNYKYNIEIHDENLTKDKMDEFFKPLNMFKSPLFGFALFNSDKISLLIKASHAVFDVESLYILLDDLIKKYNGEKLSKNHDYFDYTLDSLKNISKNDQKRLILNIYIQIMKSFMKKSKQKLFSRNKLIGSISNSFFEINIDKKVLNFLRNHETSDNYLLMYIFALSLNKLLSMDELIISYEYNGRHIPRYSQTIGLFIRMVHLPISFKERHPTDYYLKNIKKNTRSIIEKWFEKPKPYKIKQSKFFGFNYFAGYSYEKMRFKINEVIHPEEYNNSKDFLNLEIYRSFKDETNLIIKVIYNDLYYSNGDIENFTSIYLDFLEKVTQE